jgi:hypothetical protein
MLQRLAEDVIISPLVKILSASGSKSGVVVSAGGRHWTLSGATSHAVSLRSSFVMSFSPGLVIQVV